MKIRMTKSTGQAGDSPHDTARRDFNVPKTESVKNSSLEIIGTLFFSAGWMRADGYKIFTNRRLIVRMGFGKCHTNVF